jgi:hypothetical protein
VPPEAWDAVAWNRVRGNAGAIPDTYLPDINGPDGDAQHLGKHLPWVPADIAASTPGMLPILWGDPEKGHARHPNAVRAEANGWEGHWYNWIRVRKAAEGDDVEELESRYSDWPGTAPEDTGAYAVFGDGDITEDGGKNTIYLAALPSDVRSGDLVRIWAHCLTHGEYVDFVRVP